MSTLYITEFSDIGRGFGVNSISQSPLSTRGSPPVYQTVPISASSSQSTAFQNLQSSNANTILIRVHTDAICSINVGGNNPLATTSMSRMAANQTEYYSVFPGEKLAVIQNV